jgi:hypothetical protein
MTGQIFLKAFNQLLFCLARHNWPNKKFLTVNLLSLSLSKDIFRLGQVVIGYGSKEWAVTERLIWIVLPLVSQLNIGLGRLLFR